MNAEDAMDDIRLLLIAGPRPESEALPLQWWQIGRKITFRATKGRRVKPRQTRLLAPLARDLAKWRLRAGRPGDNELVFGDWSGDDWDNWRERIFSRRRSPSVFRPTRSRATCAARSRAR